MSSVFKKNPWLIVLIIAIIIIILGIIRLMGTSTWFTGWGLGIWTDFFSGQRPLTDPATGWPTPIGWGVIVASIVIVILIIYFLRSYFIKRRG